MGTFLGNVIFVTLPNTTKQVLAANDCQMMLSQIEDAIAPSDLFINHQ